MDPDVLRCGPAVARSLSATEGREVTRGGGNGSAKVRCYLSRTVNSPVAPPRPLENRNHHGRPENRRHPRLHPPGPQRQGRRRLGADQGQGPHRRGLRPDRPGGLPAAAPGRGHPGLHGPVHGRAHQGVGGHHRPLRRVHLRDAGVQPLHLGCAEERHRLHLRRVEQQGRRLRQLRRCRRRPRDRAPARHHQRAADSPRAAAAELLALPRLRELLRLHAGRAARRRGRHALRPAGVVGRRPCGPLRLAGLTGAPEAGPARRRGGSARSDCRTPRSSGCG